MCSAAKNDVIVTSTEMSTCGARKKQRKGADTDAAEYYSRDICVKLARFLAWPTSSPRTVGAAPVFVIIKFVPVKGVN
jgi:hypothetical protein